MPYPSKSGKINADTLSDWAVWSVVEQFLLGHSSIQTTERYLGSEQDIEIAVNDNLGL